MDNKKIKDFFNDDYWNGKNEHTLVMGLVLVSVNLALNISTIFVCLEILFCLIVFIIYIVHNDKSFKDLSYDLGSGLVLTAIPLFFNNEFREMYVLLGLAIFILFLGYKAK